VKNISFLIVAALFFGVFGVSFAQESVEQYLMSLKEPKEADYVRLLYEGSRENKLLAISKLIEAGARSEETKEAFVFGLQQGTIFVQRQAGKVVNDYWDVRAMSAKALGEIGDPGILEQLHQSLRYDPDVYVRSAVAAAIGKIGETQSIKELSRAIETSRAGSTEDKLILACVIALGEIGDKEGFVPLLEVIRGKYNRQIKMAARDSLKKIKW
jgi:HEAT repeat protein